MFICVRSVSLFSCSFKIGGVPYAAWDQSEYSETA